MTQLEELGSRLSPERRELLRTLAGRRAEPARIPRADRSGGVQASFAQARLWLVDQLEQGASAYHVPLPLRLRGPLDADALAGALNDMPVRHEALRTTFRDDEERGLLQVVRDAAAVELPLTDLSDPAAAADRAEALRGLAAREQERPFDLGHGPLLRARLVRLAPQEHVLLLVLHHIGFDGWSVPLLHADLAACYNARVRGEPAPAPAAAPSYADYSVWQRKQLSGDRRERLLSHWRDRLAGLPELDLPTDRPVTDVRSSRGGSHTLRIDAEQSARLNALCRSEGVSLYMAFSAVLGTLFARHTGATDFAFGTTYAGRDQPELRSLIGFFTNTFVFRQDLSGDPGFRGLLRRTRSAALADYAHAALPFDLLVDDLQPPRTGNRTPFFRVHFQVEESVGKLTAYEELPAYEGLEVTGVVPELVGAKFDLGFTLRAAADGAAVDLVHSADLFEPETAERLLAQVGVVLGAVLDDPDRPLSALDVPDLPRPAGHDAAAAPAAGPADPDDPATPGVGEGELAEVRAAWAAALGHDDFGDLEDFFTLGGNSFAAIKVRRRLGNRVPMLDLFRHRTVRALAARLSGTGTGQSPEEARLWHELTPAGGGRLVTLLCVPYAGGNGSAYQALADRLPPTVGLWAAALPGHEDDVTGSGLSSLTDTARLLAEEARERFGGDVAVYGHCAGASQAVDLARELEERGASVRAVFIGAGLTDPDAAANLSRATDSSDEELYGYIKAIGGFDGPLDDADLKQVLTVLRHDMVGATRFQASAHARPPRRLRAPLHCVLGDADPATPQFATAYRGWEVFAESVSLDVIAGAGHYFVRDRARELAGILTRSLIPDDGRTTVVCLGHTGAGASFFHPWSELADEGLRIVPVELPGREKRLAEEPCLTVDSAVDDLLPQVVRAAGDRGRVVLFGHCLGGVLAFELVRRLQTETDVTVSRLLVSGAPGPSVPRARRATGLPDAEFLARLEELAGYRHPALSDPDMVELLLPVLRADLQLYESYRQDVPVRLSVPVTVLRGTDDTLVSAAAAATWQEATDSPVRHVEFPGGHMYLTDHAGDVLDLIAEEPA